VLHFDANNAQLFIGGQNNEGDIRLYNNAGNQTIHLDGQSGDIELENGDAAEDFDVVDAATALPGTLMSLGDDGVLQPSQIARDPRVVGVVAGLGQYRPGLVLDRRSSAATPRAPISIMGKTVVRVCAEGGPIRTGDILTSSSQPGIAMRADGARAVGAIIGKALQPCEDPSGEIPILVTLH
jgi:hypothetical protein